MNGLKNGIRQKLMFLLLVSSVLPLSISMLITYRYSRKHFRSEAVAYNQNLIYQFRFNIAGCLNRIAGGVYYPYSTSSVYTILTKKADTTYDEYNTISAFMQSIYQLSGDINAVYLENASRNTAYVYTKNLLSTANLDQSPHPLEEWQVSGIIPTHDSISYGASKSLGAENRQVFTFVHPLYSVPQNKYMGKIAIDVRLDTLENLSHQMINGPGETLCLIDRGTGTIICSTDQALAGTLPKGVLASALRSITGQNGNVTVGRGRAASILFYDSVSLFDSEWLILKAIPLSSIYSDVNQVLGIYLPTYLLFLVIAVFLTWNASSHFTSPIIGLTNQMKSIKYGDPFKPLELKQNDEIRVLNDTFNSMIETINTLTINEYEWKLSNKNAQLRMLQAQLNPHFLNNALQSLGTLALKKDSSKLYSLITSLSLMMNYAMDIEQTLISLDQEFEYAENYLLFQRQRFGEQLHFELSPSPDTLRHPVPKMILQPILENYFKHGFVKRSEGYWLRAASILDQDWLIITVENNGLTMSEDALEALRQNLEKTKTFDNDEHAFGIGLINIQSRLNLYYHGNAQVLIRNLSPYGMEVRLVLSLKEENLHEGSDYR